MVEKVPLVYVLVFIASKTNNKKKGKILYFYLFLLAQEYILVSKILKNVSQKFSKAKAILNCISK